MKEKLFYIMCTLALSLIISFPVLSQVLDFDERAEGPWSDIGKTTVTTPKVANGSVKLDGVVSSSEYGGFTGISVIPGVNAWILNYAQAKEWSGPDDSSFTFYLAYDDENFYIGVDVKDDVVRSNDPNPQFWKDDAIEILIDPLKTGYDYNYDSFIPDYGGHIYFNYEGRFSNWDDAADAPQTQIRWSKAVDWYYGENEIIYGFGEEKSGGWTVEARYGKANFEDPDGIFKLQPGASMTFNIGIDDDDGADLALQYWWANRIRAIGANPDSEFWDLLTEQELAIKAYLDPNSAAAFWEVGIDANGRLSPAGAGEVILGQMVDVQNWALY